MTRHAHGESKSRAVPGKPVDMIDGIPDRTSRPAKWKYAAIALVFLAWVAFLIYCRLGGGLES